MLTVRQTPRFADWFHGLRDVSGRARILQRIARLERGNFGDAKFFDGIGELRVDCGPGYRVYFVRRGSEIVILLSGGDKSTQSRDITAAKAMAENLET